MAKKSNNSHIALSTVIQRDIKQDYTSVDGEIIMLSLKTGEYYVLNDPASRIWEFIVHPISVQSIVELLQQEYSITFERCLKDTLNFLTILKDNNLINNPVQ